MRPRERQTLIAELVGQEGQVSVETLAARFDVSTETIRRDLSQLAENGVLQKVHGGAKRPRLHVEGTFQERMTESATAKRAIAAKLRDHLQAGETLFMDTGSTTLICAEELAEAGPFTVITNSVGIATVLSVPQSANTVFLVGGRFAGDNRETLGAMAIGQLDMFRADRAVLTVAAIDRDGVMDADFEEAQVARAMIDRARHTIVVADSSKFDRTAAFKVCDLDDVDLLISDTRPGPELASALERASVEVA